MPPSWDTVFDQPAIVVTLAELGVTGTLFDRAASSQGVANQVSTRLDEVGFVLANKDQVEDAGFDPSVSLFVNATGEATGKFRYSQGRQMVRVTVTHGGTRDDSLASILPAVMKAFSQGSRVCVHCKNSFHRAPVLFAALCRSLSGINAQIAMEVLSKTRWIWWEHLQDECTGSSLSVALRWARNLSCCLPAASSQATGSRQGPAQLVLVPASAVERKKGAASSQARRYVYRAMTRSLSEFHPQRISMPNWTGEVLAYQMLRAVDRGDEYESKWLHCSWKFGEARFWQERGRTARVHTDSFIFRIDLVALEEWALRQDATARSLDFRTGLALGQVIDMSTVQCRRLFEENDWSARVDDLYRALRDRSALDREVLICWRGHVPERFFEIVDNERGMFVRELGDAAEVTL